MSSMRTRCYRRRLILMFNDKMTIKKEMPAHLPKEVLPCALSVYQEGEHTSVLWINPFTILDDITAKHTGRSAFLSFSFHTQHLLSALPATCIASVNLVVPCQARLKKPSGAGLRAKMSFLFRRNKTSERMTVRRIGGCVLR